MEVIKQGTIPANPFLGLPFVCETCAAEWEIDDQDRQFDPPRFSMVTNLSPGTYRVVASGDDYGVVMLCPTCSLEAEASRRVRVPATYVGKDQKKQEANS